MQHIFNDHFYMAEALRLARKGEYSVRINPRAGCVIVKNEKIIGSGYHVVYGQSHAEVNALDSVKESAEGATVYVTLEPCAHQGNTPPCVEALIHSKVARVVAATEDPNPLVNGKGLKKLQEHGIEISCNVLKKEAQELNKGFFKRITTHLPYITTKSAISLDGKTALASGESMWITGEEARYDVHKLRARSCAILTGVGTVVADDPQLTSRLSEDDSKGLVQPIKVILDSTLRIPLTANVLHSTSNVIIYTLSQDEDKLRALQKENIEVLQVEKFKGHVNIEMVMRDLANRGVNEVLIESGPTLIGNFIESSMVDEMIIYLAPQLLGCSDFSLANIYSITSMQDRIDLKIIENKMIGRDIKLTTKPKFN